MLLRLKKKADGQAVLTVVRADGSATSGRLGTGGFGAVHDLAHYVVETTLQLKSGFYGLLAQGWNIPDFEIKGTSNRLPDEAIVTECIVGQLTNAVFGQQAPTHENFQWLVAESVQGVRPGAAVPAVDADTLRQMGTRLNALVARWRALPPDGTLELDWPFS